jgi:hypothetical protein
MVRNIDLGRRSLVLDAAAAGVATAANAQVRTDMAPRILNGQPIPEPNSDQSAGLVRPLFLPDADRVACCGCVGAIPSQAIRCCRLIKKSGRLFPNPTR